MFNYIFINVEVEAKTSMYNVRLRHENVGIFPEVYFVICVIVYVLTTWVVPFLQSSAVRWMNGLTEKWIWEFASRWTLTSYLLLCTNEEVNFFVITTLHEKIFERVEHMHFSLTLTFGDSAQEAHILIFKLQNSISFWFFVCLFFCCCSFQDNII